MDGPLLLSVRAVYGVVFAIEGIVAEVFGVLFGISFAAEADSA